MPSSNTVERRQTGADYSGILRETGSSSGAGSTQRIGAPFTGDAQLQTKSFGQERAVRASDLFPVAIARGDVATAQQAGATLAKLLGKPELEASIEAIAGRLDGKARARFEESLGSFVLIADSALTMLDYDKLGTGWDGWTNFGTNYPENREGYRTRAYRPDFDQKSQPRRDRSQVELAASLGAALAAKDPVAAVEQATVDSFLQQLGISKAASAEWKPSSSAIAKALDQELFIPLRALLDATLHLDHRGVPLNGHQPKELDQLCRGVVEEMAKHVAEGDFEEWRFSNEKSRLQLSSLTPEQVEIYKSPLELEKDNGRGVKLKTRDEQGSGLFWVTKIGGPSHGFDMLSQCLIPLLANARNGAIVVDEPGWPDVARSVTRVLPTTDGKPVLYLEMLQVDFPHDRPGRSNVTRHELRRAIIEHAAEKARRLGIDLVLAPLRSETSEAFANELGLEWEQKEMKFTLHPSAGVFEASDSLLGAHHAPQTREEIAVVPDPDQEMPRPGMKPKNPLVIHP